MSSSFGRRLLAALADATPAFCAPPQSVSVKFSRRLLVAIADAAPSFRPTPALTVHPTRGLHSNNQSTEMLDIVDFGARHSALVKQSRIRLTVPVVAALSVTVVILSILLINQHLIHSTRIVPSPVSPYAGPSVPGSLGVQDIAFSPDGKVLAAADKNGSIYLWRLATNKPTILRDPDTVSISSVAFSPDDKFLAAGDLNGNTYLWNLETNTIKTTLRCAGSGGISAISLVPTVVSLPQAALRR